MERPRNAKGQLFRGEDGGSKYDWDMIWELTQQKLSAREIASRVGCSPKTVSRVRVHFDPSRSRLGPKDSTPRTERPDWTPELQANIKAALEDRQGYAEVSKTFGVKRDILARLFPGYALTPIECGEKAVLARKFNELTGELTTV